MHAAATAARNQLEPEAGSRSKIVWNKKNTWCTRLFPLQNCMKIRERASERGEILTYNNNIVTGERVMLTPCYLPNARFEESQMETVLKRLSRVMMMSGYWGWSWERQSPNCTLPNVWSWVWVHAGVHVTPSSPFRVEMWARLVVDTGVLQQKKI